jgi:outer membrane protein assembly factor BamB
MKKGLNVFSYLCLLCFFYPAIGGALAADGTLKWKFDTGGEVTTSPAIGADGTIYVNSAGKLYALNPDGTQKWAYERGGHFDSSPAIGPDGTIYVGLRDEKLLNANLCAINPDGSKKWELDFATEYVGSPAIGPDGTIYAKIGGDIGYLGAVNPDGSRKESWAGAQCAEPDPALAGDGTIYIPGGTGLYALNPDGTQKWVNENITARTAPAIGTDGTIYVSSVLHLYALNPDGTEKWVFEVPEVNLANSTVIGSDGTIFFASDKVYAVNTDGTQKWAFNFGNGSWLYVLPAIGADGTVYVGSDDKNIYAINPNGTMKWSFLTGDKVRSSPAIGPDGTVYVGSNDHYLYAINGSSGGLAHTGWPMFHRGLKHTASNAIPPLPNIKANGSDGSITVSAGAVVSINVSMNTGSFAGQYADWWVVEKTPSGAWNHFDLATHSMVSGLAPTHQGALFNLGSTQLLNASDLSTGSHIFYFGVDLNMSGTLDMDSIYHDHVNVTVQPQ